MTDLDALDAAIVALAGMADELARTRWASPAVARGVDCAVRGLRDAVSDLRGTADQERDRCEMYEYGGCHDR